MTMGSRIPIRTRVAVFKDITGAYAILTIDAGKLSNVRATGVPTTTDLPGQLDFSSGFFGFTITALESGGSAKATLVLHPKEGPLTTYYRDGPTPDYAAYHWYEFLQAENSTGRGHYPAGFRHQHHHQPPGWTNRR